MVWTRLAMASFGVITPVLSVVVSVFMLGLALGSWLGGKMVGALSWRWNISPLILYGSAEAVIGTSSIAVPWLFSRGEALLMTSGEFNSASYLWASAGILGISLLPWCFCMGATIPFAMQFLRQQQPADTGSFSHLYLANVLGALSGTILSSFVLIELLGLHGTLYMGALGNTAIALTALALSKGRAAKANRSPASQLPPAAAKPHAKVARVRAVLFVTGFTSLGMEIAWTRAYTPILGTQVYAFASLLFVYLLATFIGSAIYRALRTISSTRLSNGDLVALLSFSAFLPVLVNDPQWHQPIYFVMRTFSLDLRCFPIWASLFPFCLLLGYLTPSLIDEYCQGDAASAGSAYALNTLGCILGPLVTAYCLLPLGGTRNSLLLLALPYICLMSFFWKVPHRRINRVLGLASIPLLFFGVFYSKSYDEYVYGIRQWIVRRDHTATVVSGGSGMNKILLVNGVGITQLTTITKTMAHLPLAALLQKPQSTLTICFGMGTTYRSLLSWDIQTTAVELVPSVKAAFGYYFPDAESILHNPKGKIVIDDGRRYLNRVQEKYDVVTIDPPPPIEAAGSSLLYTQEFYGLIRQRLQPGGILQQWYPFGEEKTAQAMAKSLVNSFPYVRAFRSIEGWGYHFLASQSPLELGSAAQLQEKMPPSAQKDFLEWMPEKRAEDLFAFILGREVPIQSLIPADPAQVITDDHPYNEYYLLRRLRSPSP